MTHTNMVQQAVMGSLVKRFWAQQQGVDPATIYHCSIMPCFDKKLEAARDDFDLPGKSHSCLPQERRVGGGGGDPFALLPSSSHL